MAQIGACTNFGACSKADNKEPIAVPPGTDPLCPECNQPLTINRGSVGGGGPGKILAAAGAALTLLVLVAATLLLRSGHPAPGSDQAVREQLVEVWPWLK